MDELYAPKFWVLMFHSFPRPTFRHDLEFMEDPHFSSTDINYLHGFALAASIPLLLLIFSMIGFLTYYNCIKCKRSNMKNDARDSSCNCSQCIIGFFSLLVLCGAGATVYGSIEVQKGVEFSLKSIVYMSNSLTSVSKNVLKSRDFAQDLEFKFSEILKSISDNDSKQQIGNITVDLQANVAKFPHQLLPGIEGLDWLANVTQKVDKYRSIAAYSYVGVIVLVCFFALLGLLFRSRGCLITTTFFGQLILMVSFVHLGCLFLSVIVLSDICITPYIYIHNETMNKIDLTNETFTYYMKCLSDQKLKLPYLLVSEDAKSQMSNINEILEEGSVTKYDQKLAVGIELNIVELETSLNMVISELRCKAIATPVEDFVNSWCYFVFDGLLVGLFAVCFTCVSLIVLLIAAPLAWRKLGRVDPYSADETAFANGFQSYHRNGNSYLSGGRGALPGAILYPANTRTTKVSSRRNKDDYVWGQPPPYSPYE